MKIKKDQSLAIFRGQSEDRAAHGRVTVLVFETSIRGARIRGLPHLIDRHGTRRNSAQLRAIEVRRQREQPGRKRGILTPLPEPAEGAKKSLLRHLFSTAAIPAKTVSQVEEGTLPAPDDFLESGNVPGQHPLDRALIVARAHSGFRLKTFTQKYDTATATAVALFQNRPRVKKVQPELPGTGPTDRKQKNFKELTMAFELDSNAVGVVAVAIPVVGSIALFSFLSVAAWSDARRKEREEYYRNETLKKIAESSGEGAKAAIELLREQNHVVTKRRLEGMKLGGLITAVVGIGVMVLLRGLVNDEPVYLAGLIPLLVGVALLAYAFLLAPKEAV